MYVCVFVRIFLHMVRRHAHDHPGNLPVTPLLSTQHLRYAPRHPHPLEASTARATLPGGSVGLGGSVSGESPSLLQSGSGQRGVLVRPVSCMAWAAAHGATERVRPERYGCAAAGRDASIPTNLPQYTLED